MEKVLLELEKSMSKELENYLRKLVKQSKKQQDIIEENEL